MSPAPAARQRGERVLETMHGGPFGQPLRYLSAWFCPFAHRTTIAFEHHADVVEWEWEEALGWERRTDAAGEETHVHWKSDSLLRHNPSGMVPTIVGHDGRAVYESLLCVEFIDEVAAQRGGYDLLLPRDPWERARCRQVAEAVNKRCCSPYYSILVCREDDERRAAHAALLDGVRWFASELPDNKPFFGGDTLSLVDVALLPHAWRYYVLEHFRGAAFAVRGTDAPLARFAEWLEAMTALPQVARTLPDQERYLQHVTKYAMGTARSKVANAVRRGAAAHDADDRDDGMSSTAATAKPAVGDPLPAVGLVRDLERGY